MWVNLLIALVIGFAVTMLANLATTIYLHRTLAHRSMTMRPGLAWFFRLVVWITVGIKPRQWVAVHRKHHAFTDVEGDPHSPVLLGWVQGAAHERRRSTGRWPPTRSRSPRYARTCPPDKWDRYVFDHAFVGLGIGIAFLCVVLGPVVGPRRRRRSMR